MVSSSTPKRHRLSCAGGRTRVKQKSPNFSWVEEVEYTDDLVYLGVAVRGLAVGTPLFNSFSPCSYWQAELKALELGSHLARSMRLTGLHIIVGSRSTVWSLHTRRNRSKTFNDCSKSLKSLSLPLSIYSQKPSSYCMREVYSLAKGGGGVHGSPTAGQGC